MQSDHETILVAILTAEGVLIAALVAGIVALVGHLWKRITDLEQAHIELWRLREADAITKRKQGDHIDVLEDHIRQDLGPPPPPRPEGV